MSEHQTDVLIIGAGVSGISAAVHLRQRRPDHRFVVLEQRSQLGGTWDLFRYPGIRSDSDLHTYGFRFRPWREPRAIADGPSILRYLHDTVDELGVADTIRYERRVRSASWSSEQRRWTVSVQVGDGSTETWTARFLWMCGGYFSYDEGHDPPFPGSEEFTGRIVHPQFWPPDLDHTGRRIVVIGSGATAATLIPALATEAAHVTMLQRSPSYVVALPADDPVARLLLRVLPDRLAYRLIRAKNVALIEASYRAIRRWPNGARKLLIKGAARHLPDGFDVATHFTPSYDPWDERMVVVPDGDLFRVLSDGSASVVTDHIEGFTPTGIQLRSGRHLDADVIVTATGLKVQTLGGSAVDVDGEAVKTGDTFLYKGVMLSGVPNLAVTLGYATASWTLKADLTSRWVCRLLGHMRRQGHDQVVAPTPAGSVVGTPAINLNSGYVQRAVDILPKRGTERPWRSGRSYLPDLAALRYSRLDDGVLRFSRAAAGGPTPPTGSNAPGQPV